jgi:hypothetical protein
MDWIEQGRPQQGPHIHSTRPLVPTGCRGLLVKIHDRPRGMTTFIC